MARRSFFVACTLVFSLALAPIAGADPILITGGSVVVPGSTGGQVLAPVDISGTRGFSMKGITAPSESHLGAVCFFCEPESTVLVYGAIFGSSGVRGTVSLDGVDYSLPLDFEGPLLFLEFGPQTFALPELGTETLVLTAPFVLTGAFQNPFTPDDPQPPRMPISGRGITRLTFLPFPGSEFDPPAWKLEATRYEFADATAVPEPASLTLIGLGLAAGLVSRRGRRARR